MNNRPEYNSRAISNTLMMLTLLFALLGFFYSDSHAGSLPDGVASYIDFDGDGFDDNLPDVNEDGIPDRFHSSKIKINPDNENQGIDILSEIGGSSSILPVISVQEQFSIRRLTIRGLESCRSDFESDFGSGFGAGIATGGGACTGGICF